MKKIKDKISSLLVKIKNDPISLIVVIVSICILILSSIIFNFLVGLIIFIVINLIYWGYVIMMNKKKNIKGKKYNTSKNSKSSKSVNTKTKKIKKKKKVLKIILLIILIFFIMMVTAITGFIAYIVIKAPEFNEELLYLSEPSILLTKDGKEFARIGEEKRVTITYDEIPEVLIDAIVATEDSNFFEHNGVDWARFLKASFYQLLGKSDAGGASTLTMQVSKNRYTNKNDEGIEGIIRKFTDVYVSMFILEKNYTKEKIMEFYVNSQWLGKNTYGVEQTALTYFGKSAKELNLAEAAMIAGLFQAPGKYDPYDNPEATETRRQTVLKLMLRHGYINKDEYNAAKKLTVDKIVIPQEQSKAISKEVSEYQSFIDTVVSQVTKKTGKNPYTTSMTIYTTMDTSIQDYINNIMSGKTYNWENDKVQAGIAVVNVKNGSIAAIGGNRKVDALGNYNYATDITKQIGSTAKPLYDYGPAIEYNNWSSYQIVTDEPTTYSDGTSINNWDKQFKDFLTIRYSLSDSRNIPALKTFKSVDKAKIIEFVTNLGLTPEIYSCDEGYELNKKVCTKTDEKTGEVITVDAKKSSTLHEAHAIGGYNGESPLTLAAAYAAFGNGGTYNEPYAFTKVIFKDNNEEYINDTVKRKAMSAETAYIISDMLISTAPSAIGRYYNINGIRYSAKTGTTNYDDATMQAKHFPSNAVNDLWAVGYNTEYSIAVWYGYDNLNDGYNIFGSAQHTRLFQAVGKKVFTNGTGFTKPAGVVSVEVESGCPEASLPSEFTPSNLRITELFVKGAEPKSTSPRFAKLSDVSNLTSSTVDNVVTLSWSAVSNPEINTQEYLLKYFGSVYKNQQFLQNQVNNRLAWNRSNLGNLGYNIYLKDSNGKLKLLDYVTTNQYTTTLDEVGEYTFVVKTAYSIFKANMSDGKTTTVTVDKVNQVTPDNPTDENGDNNTDSGNQNT